MLSLVWVDLILDMWLQQLHRVLVVFGDKAQCQIFSWGSKSLTALLLARLCFLFNSVVDSLQE